MIAEEPPAVIIDGAGDDGIERSYLDTALAEVIEEKCVGEREGFRVVPNETIEGAGVVEEESHPHTGLCSLGTDLDELLANLVIYEDELLEIDARLCTAASLEHVFPHDFI